MSKKEYGNNFMKMNKTLFILILCNLMLLLTAMTCDDPIEYRKVIFDNQSNDTIMVLSESGRPFTSETAIELYLAEWSTLIPPSDHSKEPLPDRDGEFLFLAVLKKQLLDKYSKEEIIEKDLVEFYSYSYQELKKMNFKIVYGGDKFQDSSLITFM